MSLEQNLHRLEIYCDSLFSPMGDAPSPPEITQLLIAWDGGDKAGRTTALVNEVYLRLIDWKHVEWHDRAQFFAAASQMMRRILVDYARERRTEKRGGAAVEVSLSEAAELGGGTSDVVALDETLEAQEKLSPRQSRTVGMRFFGGLSLEETAEVLGVSVGTVRRDWSMARAWLFRELSRKGGA